jgi:LEA14-like dessication related protein
MKRLLLPFLAASVLLSGCALLSELLTEVFQKPSFRFKNVALHNASLAGINLDTVWQLDNPNTVGISLAAIDYALFIDNKQVVAGAPQKGLQIPAKGSTDLTFPAEIKFLEIVPALEALLTKDTATWKVEGSIGLQTPIGILSFPLAMQDVFETPKLPQVQFADPKVTNISLQGATVSFPLSVTNRSSFPLGINEVVGTLSIAGSPVGTLSTGTLGQLEGKGTRQVSLPLTINFFSAGSAAVNAIKGGNANLKFDAQVQSGGAQVPLKLDQLVNFAR